MHILTSHSKLLFQRRGLQKCLQKQTELMLDLSPCKKPAPSQQLWLSLCLTFTRTVTKYYDSLVLSLQWPLCVLLVTLVRRVWLCHANNTCFDITRKEIACRAMSPCKVIVFPYFFPGTGLYRSVTETPSVRHL